MKKKPAPKKAASKPNTKSVSHLEQPTEPFPMQVAEGSEQPSANAASTTDAAFPEPFPTEAPDDERTAESEMDAGSQGTAASVQFPTQTQGTHGRAGLEGQSEAVAANTTVTTQVADAKTENELGADPFPTETRKDSTGSPGTPRDTTQDTQIAADKSEIEMGDDRVSDASTDSQTVDSPIEIQLSSRVSRLPGEGRSSCHERLRRLARSAGMPRGQGPGTAYNWAFDQCDRLFAKPEPEPIPEPPAADPEPEPVLPTVGKTTEPTISVSAAPDDGSVSGLSDLPPGWPELPANAQLQVEIGWVTANRLRVRSGTGVDLSRALSPAPSYSALSWLETSILFPAKFADISVKATSQSDDEREHIRREKLAIDEIRSILGEMLEAK